MDRDFVLGYPWGGMQPKTLLSRDINDMSSGKCALKEDTCSVQLIFICSISKGHVADVYCILLSIKSYLEV